MIEHFQHLRAKSTGPAAPGSFQQLMLTIENHREQNLKRMFANAQIKFKQGAVRDAATDLGDQAVSVVEQATGQNLRPQEAAKSNFQEMVESATGVAYSDLVSYLPGVNDIRDRLLPVIGIFTAVRDLAGSINEFRRAVMERYRAAKAVSEIAAGDALAAAHGVTRMINRLLINTGADMLRSTGQFAAGLATMPVDGGIIVNLAATVTQFIQTLISVGLDIAECKAARTCLAQNVLDKRIFQSSPLMGCYLLTCSNTSDIVGMLGKHTSQLDWMTKVERSKQKIDALQTTARKFIANSRLEVTGLPMGMVVKAA